MKGFCVNLCLIGVLGLLISDVGCWNGYDDDSVFGIYPTDYEDPTDEEYPQFDVILDYDNKNVNTEENEIETGEPKQPSDVETTHPSGEGTFVVIDALPDTETSSDGPTCDERFDKLKEEVEKLKERVDKLEVDFKARQDTIAKLEETNRILTLKIDSIEQQVKTNSIILTNVRQDPNETSKTTLQRVLHVFNRVMRVRVSASDIAVALRAESNASAGGNGNNPIVVRFTTFATKMKVLAASNRLSRTAMAVSSDYSELVAQKRAALVPYLQRARAEGRRAYILYDRLVVDGVKVTLEELRAREEAQPETDEQVEMIELDP